MLDLTAVIVLFVVGCFLWKLCMSYDNARLAFDAPALGIFAIGELVWWRVRKRIVKRIEDKVDDRNTRTSNGKF